ncbi:MULTISPECIES: hypothetical protein [Methylobacterium]|uniref:Uncharacterized protein n=2 Tax=Methylobacterium TaxID=407 RepID=A0A8H8X145_9HYPH|nr:hypothetical protein [Methylobacterium indicum]BCM87774.1 hypothetical protein mvi_62350 [Methylobacterium indicum]
MAYVLMYRMRDTEPWRWATTTRSASLAMLEQTEQRRQLSRIIKVVKCYADQARQVIEELSQ